MMKPSSPPNRTDFLSVLILSLTATLGVLTFLILWGMFRPSLPVLGATGATAALFLLIAYRCLFPARPRRKTAKRIAGTVLSLVISAVCLTASGTAVFVSNALNTMIDTLPMPEELPTPQVYMDPFAVYLSGSDTRDSTLTESRSDVNIIAAVNPVAKQLLLVNTPRDYYVPNPAGNGAKDKLTHCGLYGVDNSRKALSDLYDTPIVYSAQINFTGFELLIDALGGVTVESDYAFTTQNGYRIEKGTNTLNGAQALAFARERYNVPGGDNTRGVHQMRVIAALVRQASPDTILANYQEILDSLRGMFATNMPLTTITKLITTQIATLRQWQVFTYAATGTEGEDHTYSATGKLYVTYPDPQSVQTASALLHRVLSGEVLDADAVA